MSSTDPLSLGAVDSDSERNVAVFWSDGASEYTTHG